MKVGESTLHTLHWIWDMSHGMKLQAILNAICGLLTVCLDFAFIYATRWAVDIATGRDAGLLSQAAYVLIGIMLSKIALGFVRKWISALLGVRSQNILQQRIFSHLLRSEWHGLERRHSGDTLNRLERDVHDLTNVLTETVPSIFEVCIRLVIAFFYLYSMDARLACLLIFVVPFFFVLSKLYVRRMRAITREIRSLDSRIQSILQEGVQHRVVLKTLERCQTMIDRLVSAQAELRHQVRHRAVFSSTSTSLVSLGFASGYMLTFLWGVNSLQQGLITYGMMISFIQLVGQIQGPFRDMTHFIPYLINSLTSIERLMEIDEVPLEEEGEPVIFSQGAGIRLVDVDFAYPNGGRPILERFSYDFKPSSITAILGETGAGKTTLLRLVLSLLKPEQGRVEIYDADRSVQASPLTRCNLIYVPQGNTLFSGTIRENLLLGNPDASDRELREVLEVACASFVSELPDGLDSQCGEHGAGLSEGQAQRIAIARALLRKGTILLLDEATSALDTQTEKQLLSNLSRCSSSRTVICVTHRAAVVDYCTQVLTVE